MASQISASYDGTAPGAACMGKRKPQTVWPPTARHILPTGLGCWLYMVQATYDENENR